MDDLSMRVARIHASIGSTIESLPNGIDARIFRTPKIHGYVCDFSDGRTDAELANALFMIVHNIASLRDHLKEWMKRRGEDPRKVNDIIRSSRPLQIITDLWNIDKHKELDRAPWSKMLPRLINIHTAGQITAKAGQSGVWHSWSLATGKHSTNSPGSMARIVEADVVDENGKLIGGFQSLANLAIEAWERGCQQLA